ncbi:MAG: BA14K family protein [Pseudomonadota bacterium]
MSPFKKGSAIILASAMSFAAIATTMPANAHELGWRHFHQQQHMKHKLYRHGQTDIVVEHHTYHHQEVDRGRVGGVLLGILGAAIVVDALSKTHNSPPKSGIPPIYEPHASPYTYPPAPKEPHIVYHTQSLEPWTPGWLAWCKERYRSFNEHTGTYRGYDGLDHFCVPK